MKLVHSHVDISQSPSLTHYDIYLVSASKIVAWKRSKEEKSSFDRVLPCAYVQSTFVSVSASKTDIENSDKADTDIYTP